MYAAIRTKNLLLQYLYLLTFGTCLLNGESKQDSCPLWHISRNEQCECGASLSGIVSCDKQFVYIKRGNCVTWNNLTNSAELHRCLFTNFNNTCARYAIPDTYRVPIDTSGSKLGHLTCESYNRRGTHCKQCIDGYGPAAFSDSISCADCSKYQYLWVLNLLFQLIMVTLLCLALIPLQIKGTSSPLNIVITYAQLGAIGLKLGGNLRTRMVCYVGQTVTSIVITTLGALNLEFFHVVIPPLCISPSFKAVNSLLFDYIIGIYPLFLTALIYLCIEFYDRNYKIVLFLSYPVRMCFKCFHSTWDPKSMILNTFTTFFLLSYSKLLFVSINLLLSFQSYNSKGEKILNSTVLLYDPTIRFFHTEHIPYVIISLSVVLVFVLLPPLFLLLYPISLFRKCLCLFGFRRWDILHHIMDIFQGWYKDGTEGTRDYRSLSALYILIRIGLGCEFVIILLKEDKDNRFLWQWVSFGSLHIFFGMFYFTLKPYRKIWMNKADGLILTIIGVLLLLEIFDNKPVYILGAVIGFSVMTFTILYYATRKLV